MKEIVLPIKCSTVKKAHDILETIIAFLFAAGITAWGLWAISYVYWTTVADVNINAGFELLFATLAGFGLVVSMGFVLLILIEGVAKLYQSLPSIGCVKDNESKEP